MKMTQFANFANNATEQILGVTGLQCENLQSMFTYPDSITVLDLVTVSGDVIVIRDGAPINAKQAIVDIKPLQTGDNPSPTNRLPISGWDGIKVFRFGSNLADISKFVGVTNVTVSFPESGACHIVTDAQNTYRAANIRATDMTYRAGTYYIKFKVKANPIRNNYTRVALRTVVGNNLEGNFIQILESDTDKSYEGVFTTNKDCYFSYLGNGANTGEEYNSDVIIYDLTISKLDVAYELFNGKDYNIEFPANVGTVYGGVLDVTNGSLYVDRIKLKLGDFTNWNWHTSTNSYTASRITSSPFPQLKQGDIVCEIAPYVERSQLPSATIAISISASGTSIFLKDNIHSGTDGLTDFVNSIRDIEAVFYIENSQSYKISSTDILMLNGNNTIYANCGSMKLEYYRKEMEG